MNQSRPLQHGQRTHVDDSSVKGQVGQAGRDLWQFQFLFDWKDKDQLDKQNRRVLMDKVRNFWIKGVLEKSLYHQAMIELNLERRSDVLEQPFNIDWVSSNQSRQDLPAGTEVVDFFNQLGEGGTLLILGEPGSGKTIALLNLARELLPQAEQNEAYPISVVFNLSSWRGQAIADWLVQELQEKYQASPELSKLWIKTEKLLLLLDGLDEAQANLRDSCISALNQFTQGYGRTRVVVCSRTKDYEKLTQLLKFQGSILIKSLTLDQVEKYLVQAGSKLAGVRSAIQSNSALQDLVRTPLMLNAIALTYEDYSSEDLPQVNSEAEFLDRLFNAYVERMFFRRRSTQSPYQEKQAKYWLSCLAKAMSQESQSVFLIERMQPSTYLHSRTEYSVYNTGIDFLIWGIGFLLGGLTGWFIVGEWWAAIFLGLTLLGATVTFFQIFWMTQLVSQRANAFLNLSKARIRTFESLKWSWKKVRKKLDESKKVAWLIGLILGVVTGSVAGVQGVFESIQTSLSSSEIVFETIKYNPSTLFSLLLSLILAVVIGGLAGLLIGIPWSVILWIGYVAPFMVITEVGEVIEKTTFPNQGVWRSARSSGIVFLCTFLSISLVGGFLLFGLMVAFSGWESGGVVSKLTWSICLGAFWGAPLGVFLGLVPGLACIQHFVLRCILALKGNVPWNYARFLDYATERIFLQKVGGGYIFVHRLLLEHFASQKSRGLSRLHAHGLRDFQK